jgi:hypothetical protein
MYKTALTGAQIASLYTDYNSQVSIGNLQSGLVAYWPFNGNVSDDTPNSNNGTINNATSTSDRKGRASTAFSFDGSTSFISVPDSPSLEQTGNMSISAWVYPINNSNYDPIISKGASNEFDLGADFRSGATALCWQNCTTTVSSFFSGYTSTWVHVTVVVNGTTLNVYRNGVLVSSPTGLSGRSSSGNAVNIGKRPSAAYYFDGSIDDVRIWSRALSATEVAQVYAEYR